MAITYQIDSEIKNLQDWEQERPRIIAETLSEFKGWKINWDLYMKIKKVKSNDNSRNNAPQH